MTMLEKNLALCDQLHPIIREIVKDAVRAAFAVNMTFDISETIRSYARQCLLLSQGRTRNDIMKNSFLGGFRLNAQQMKDMMKIYDEGRNLQGNIVTWTLDSDHVKGVAMDIYPRNTTYAELEAFFAKWGITHPYLRDPPHFNVSMARRPPTAKETSVERLGLLKRQSELAAEPMKGWIFNVYERLRKRLRM